MSKGSIFVSPTTQHYAYLPHLEGYGLSYIDAYTFNVLANPSHPLAKKARSITEHKDVYIWDWGANNDTGFIGWFSSQLGATSMEYFRFNTSGDNESKYVDFASMTGGVDLPSLINYVESTSYSDRISNYHSGNRYAKKLHDIQTSELGHLVGPKQSKFFFPKPYANRNDRTAALKGSTLFSAVPRRASGEKYHYRGSQSEDTGTYIGGKSGLSNEDHAATVAGNLKLKWNPAQNVWEAGGGAFLATLLTDVEGANIQKPGITLDNLQGRTSDEFFKSDAIEKMSEFTTGTAIPLNLHSAHPTSFGPNITKCGGSQKLETVRVVNRGRTNFSAGERVLVNQIDGENLISKYTEETVTERPPQPGRWNFTEFMANSDEYFRAEYGTKYQGRPPVTPETAAQLMYAKYYDQANLRDWRYNHLDQDQIDMSRSELKALKLFEYWQFRSSDMMYNSEQGTLPLFGGATHRINIEVDPAGGDNIGQENVLGTEMPLWFGPMFPDGVLGTVKYGGYKFDNKQVPADLVYPYFHDAHGHIKKLNEYPPSLLGVSTDVTTSGITVVNNQNRVQFSFLQPDLMACGDEATHQLPETGGDAGRFGSFSTRARKFVDSASEMAEKALGPDQPDVFVIQSAVANNVSEKLLGKMFARRSSGLNQAKVAMKFGNPNAAGAMASMYRGFAVPGNLKYTFPYDAYIDYIPLNTAKNAPGLFGGDTGPESSTAGFQGGVSVNDYVGSNAVGITSARFRMNQGTGTSWTLAAETNQTFGMKGRFFGGGGGGGIVTTIIGAIMAFSSDTRGRTIQGSVAMWGSNKGDSIDSFGTGACHVQVWDAWPDELTHWCPQYMFALHRNPGVNTPNPFAVAGTPDLDPFIDEEPNPDYIAPNPYNYPVTVMDYSLADKEADGGAWSPEPQEIQIDIGRPSEVTYTEPTWGDENRISWRDGDGEWQEGKYPSYFTGLDGQIVSAGTILDIDSYLRPTSVWKNNRSREDKLVSLYGYHYLRRVLGLHGGTLKDKEEGFADGDYVVGRGEKQAIVTVNGNSVSYKETKWTSNSGSEFSYKERGTGYIPAELPISFTLQDAAGKTANLNVEKLEAYDRHYHDQGPKPRSSLQRVSKDSGSGTDTAVGNKGVGVSVTGNKTGMDGSVSKYPERAGDLDLYAGQYEVFIYVHNDVQFTWIREPEATTGYQFAQYITLSLG